MAGSIHKYETKSGIRYMVMYDIGTNGKRKQKKKMGFKTKKEASAFLAETLNNLNKGMYIEPSKALYGDFIEEWFQTKQISLGKQTIAVYEMYIGKYIKPALGDIPLFALKTTHINQFINEMVKKEYSAATIKKSINIIKNSLEYAVDTELLNKNVAKKATLPKEAKNEMMVWNEEEVTRFLEVAKNNRYYAFFFLALFTGMRRGEILGLRWKDINFDRKQLTITQVLTKDGKEFITGAKTKAGNRTIDLSESTLKVLKAQKAQIAQDKLALGQDYIDYDLVIATPMGTPVHPSNLRQREFVPLIEKAKVPKIRIHDLRHTHATLLFSKGINVKVISERLGHSNIKVTLDTYSHVLPTMQKEAVQKLDDMLSL